MLFNDTKAFVCTANRLCYFRSRTSHVCLLYSQAFLLPSTIFETKNKSKPSSTRFSQGQQIVKVSTLLFSSSSSLFQDIIASMRLHPHKKWALEYSHTKPAKSTRIAKKCYLQRLYARASNFLIRACDLPSQAELNDRETQLQAYLEAERVTRGNGSPLHSNPQQVLTFSATDEVPKNTVLDDFTEFVDPFPVDEQDLAFVMIPSMAPQTENTYQHMVDRSHRRLGQSLLAAPSGLDMTTTMRMERRAQGF